MIVAATAASDQAIAKRRKRLQATASDRKLAYRLVPLFLKPSSDPFSGLPSKDVFQKKKKKKKNPREFNNYDNNKRKEK